jgi:hypothetical protein
MEHAGRSAGEDLRLAGRGGELDLRHQGLRRGKAGGAGSEEGESEDEAGYSGMRHRQDLRSRPVSGVPP